MWCSGSDMRAEMQVCLVLIECVLLRMVLLEGCKLLW